MLEAAPPRMAEPAPTHRERADGRLFQAAHP